MFNKVGTSDDRANAHNTGFIKLSSLRGGSKDGREPVKLGFRDTLRDRLDSLQNTIQDWDALDVLELSQEEIQEAIASYRDHISKAIMRLQVQQKLKTSEREEDQDGATLAHNLLEAYASQGVNDFDTILKYGFYGHAAASKFSTQHVRIQKSLADLRYPLEWYAKTRELRRTIHLHVGPTNSGKTYQALKALEAAPRGLYAGPLRLLAHEVYTRLNAAGRRCELVTGEERRFPDDNVTNTDMISCTVEMVDCNSRMDVAVIDEIQMIGSEERGWAWTQALLGVQAKEVHLCGEERTVPLIKALAAMMGDPLEVHRYERLSPLEMDTHHMQGNLKALRKGDCIVAFSVLGIHALKKTIERVTNKKVAIVYGSLPPETRAQQARLFNDPDNDYDFLVASDAVGMGLNLSIRRLIFESSQKHDGTGMRTLKVAEVKQIAGRAGRYRTAHQAVKEAASTLDSSPPDVQPSHEFVDPNNNARAQTQRAGARTLQSQSSIEAVMDSSHMDGEDSTLERDTKLTIRGDNKTGLLAKSNVGLVTTLYEFDFPIISRAMQMEPEPIKSAGLHPPASVVERFTSYFPPGTPFSYILLRLNEISQMNPRFHLCGLRDNLLIADAIHSVENLTTADRIIMCAAPVTLNRDPTMKTFLLCLAHAVANGEGGSLLDIPPSVLPLERIDEPVSGGREYLRDMEQLHKMIILYLWLSYRFSGVFTTRQLAFYVKSLIEQRIDAALSKFNFSEASRRKFMEAREKLVMEELEDAVNGEDDDPAAARGLGEPSGARTDDETAEPLDIEEDDELDAEEATPVSQVSVDAELVEKPEQAASQ